MPDAPERADFADPPPPKHLEVTDPGAGKKTQQASRTLIPPPPQRMRLR